MGESNFFDFENKVTKKTRIGFISDFLIRQHSVFKKDRHKVIEYLSKNPNFEVYLITFSGLQFKQQEIFKILDNIALGNKSIHSNITLVRNL